MKRKISAARRAQLLKLLEKARKAKKRKAPRDIEQKMERAQKRRVAKRKAGAKRPRKKNPIRDVPLYAIKIQKGNGPIMHYDGMKFTNNGKAKHYDSVEKMRVAVSHMKARYPILNQYRIFATPIKGTASGKF